MVVGSCRSFLLLATTQNEVDNCAKVTLDGRLRDFVRVSRTHFSKLHFPLTLLAAFSRTFSQIHESRMSFYLLLFFFFICEIFFFPLLRVTHKPSPPSVK